MFCKEWQIDARKSFVKTLVSMLQAVCRILIHILCACDRLLVMIGCIFPTAIIDTTHRYNFLYAFDWKISATSISLSASFRVLGNRVGAHTRFFSGCAKTARFRFVVFCHPLLFGLSAVTAMKSDIHKSSLGQLLKHLNPLLIRFFPSFSFCVSVKSR